MEQRLTVYGREPGYTNLGRRTINRVTGWIEKSWLGSRIIRSLEAAGLNVSLFTFTAIVVVICGILGVAVQALLQLPLTASMLLGTMAGLGVVLAFLDSRKDSYERAFVAQAPDITQLLSNSLKAGLSLYQAIKEVEEKMPNPAQREFRRVRQAVDFGEPIDRVLVSLAKRHPAEEWHIISATLIIQRRSGGDLVKALSAMSNAIAARQALRREIDSITSSSRYNSLAVILLPLGVLIMMNQISPNIVARFTAEPLGVVFFILYAMVQVGAFLLVRHVSDIKV